MALCLAACSAAPTVESPPEELAQPPVAVPDELTFVRSTGVGLPEPGELVGIITPNEIVLEVTLELGTDSIAPEERSVLELEQGYIAPVDFQAPNSPIAPRLVDAFERALADQVPQEEHLTFLADLRIPTVYVTLAFDRTTPFATVAAVMWAATAAGTVDFRFAVESTSWRGLWVEDQAVRGPGLVSYTTVRSFQPMNESEETFGLLPDLAVHVTEAGFVIEDLAQTELWARTGLGSPIPSCPQGAGSATICNRADAGGDLLSRLDFRELYNYLVLVRQHPELQRVFETNGVLLIGGPGDLPFEVIVRVADVARQMLPQDRYDDDDTFWNATAEDEGPGSPLFPSFSTLIPSP